MDDKLPFEDEIAQQLRGGGRAKNPPIKKEEGLPDDPLPPPKSSQSIDSGASTPNRELERLTVPTPLKLADEYQLTYANNGRVQRSRKRPAIYDPLAGPASVWRSDGDNTPPGKWSKGRVEMPCGDVATVVAASAKVDGPEPLRGGARPKKEEAAAASARPSSPAAVDENAPPRPRGRPPSKQTKRGVATKKQNAKRALIKKETNENVHGVGILNRKPGSLFDSLPVWIFPR